MANIKRAAHICFKEVVGDDAVAPFIIITLELLAERPIIILEVVAAAVGVFYGRTIIRNRLTVVLR